MDRLYIVAALIGAALVVSACDSKNEPPPTRSSRVNAVAAKKPAEAPAPADFCDRYHDAGAGPELTFPDIEGSIPAAPKSGWRWINVWATWCKPCVEELPRLTAWEKKLASDGLGQLILVSADSTKDVVAKFEKTHPEVEGTVRIATEEGLSQWIADLGFAEGSALPLHIFVDPAGRVRCLRAAGVNESDYAAVVRLLGS